MCICVNANHLIYITNNLCSLITPQSFSRGLYFRADYILLKFAHPALREFSVC